MKPLLFIVYFIACTYVIGLLIITYKSSEKDTIRVTESSLIINSSQMQKGSWASYEKDSIKGDTLIIHTEDYSNGIIKISDESALLFSIYVKDKHSIFSYHFPEGLTVNGNLKLEVGE